MHGECTPAKRHYSLFFPSNRSRKCVAQQGAIILPPPRAANFAIIWFGNRHGHGDGAHPPVGLNVFVIRNVAPDITLSEVIWGRLPFVLLMMLAVVVLCFVPAISTALPDLVMGPDGAR